jgi:maltooligosyltrehalose trehalohydrolase
MQGTPADRLPAYADPPGASYLGADRCLFRVWSPHARSIAVQIEAPTPRTIALRQDSWGYWSAIVEGLPPATRYRYLIDDTLLRPDMAARAQPEGVHGASEVVDPAFTWTDAGWYGIPLRDYVIYELHVGAFSAEGTFEAIIPQLAALRELGVTAIELMPVASFPGERGWGYDGVALYAPHPAYGGPQGLKRLVDACHQAGLAVVLDVVYNHLGPEGNYLWDYGPYFTDRYRTPWGDAVNFDGPYSYGVRHFFIANALYWLREYHIDALRLDAVHAIYDFSARHVLAELAEQVAAQAKTLNRRAYLIAESALNDARIIRPPSVGGHGLDSQWSDDLHHALHVLLTGERDGYYADFGSLEQLATAYMRSFVYAGEYSPHARRFLGGTTAGCTGQQFVVCAQNHDQVGNRALGERFSATLPLAALKLAAAAYLLAPFVPLIFMGEEYGELAPFQYFTSHGDPALAEAVRAGRIREFADFVAPGQTVPDPQDPATFQRSKLDHSLRQGGHHRLIWDLYCALLGLRRERPALRSLDMAATEAQADEASRTLWLRRSAADDQVIALFNFGPAPVERSWPLGPGRWSVLLDTADPRWEAPAPPEGAARPTLITTQGHVMLGLAGMSCLLLGRLADDAM